MRLYKVCVPITLRSPAKSKQWRPSVPFLDILINTEHFPLTFRLIELLSVR